MTLYNIIRIGLYNKPDFDGFGKYITGTWLEPLCTVLQYLVPSLGVLALIGLAVVHLIKSQKQAPQENFWEQVKIIIGMAIVGTIAPTIIKYIIG